MNTKRTVAAFVSVALVAAGSSYAFNQHTAAVERNAYRAGFMNGKEFGYADCHLTPKAEGCVMHVPNLPENKYPVLRARRIFTPMG